MYREHMKIVLVRPQGAMNIGSVARAMKNMGLKHLSLVDPVCSPLHPDARLMSVSAQDILENATIVNDLASAVADSTWVVGTTRRVGKAREGIKDPRQMAREIKEIIDQNKVAIVFGTETSGLSNRDLDLCQRMVTIPSHDDFGSLNLAQAVMVVCYEIFMAVHNKEEIQSTRSFASSEELEGMYGHMEDMLLKIGFLDENNPKRIMTVLRRILGRAKLNTREVKILRGICRQASWFSRQGRVSDETDQS